MLRFTHSIMIKICNKVIEYSFYALFLLVPLALTSATSELFELNKMWLTWGIAIIIGTAWFTKMVLQRRILFQRTLLDIPIGLFLASQIISTIFSLDVHTSFWGYYSRFNGGLLSTISYIFLYYAFLSNLGNLRYLKRILIISLVSGLIVALWGLPSHFGYDPTCFLFRGTLDVSCWTADFLPKIRIFSTLGQPDWLAAYLAILIPITIASAILNNFKKPLIHLIPFLLLILFYIDLLFTRARSGFLGIWVALIFFFGLYFWTQRKSLKSLIINHLSLIIIPLLLITFVIGTPIAQLNGFTLEGISKNLQKIQTTKTARETGLPASAKASAGEGGTESVDIRLLVWTGAVNAWKANPIFGTGVETFAFAYYKYKPVGQNLTSEWNFLYNKAHNEYLNYLATTGIVGLGTYLSMIFVFLWVVLAKITNSFANFAKQFASIREKQEHKSPQNNVLILALLSGYISILVTNFFGFSVVITNIYLFIIPAFIFVLGNMIKTEKSAQSANLSAKINNNESVNLYQWSGIFFIILASLFMILALFRFWLADKEYALGYNFDRAGEYQQAYPHLQNAVELRGSEPVFRDELSINNAVVAVELISAKGKDTSQEILTSASSFAENAIKISDEVILRNEHNPVFFKTRVRLFYTLSQVDSKYLPKALEGIQRAALLAPNDANILYNLGILYGQNNNIAKGIETLEKTVQLKPDYRDARYGLGLFYHEKDLNEKALGQMRYILRYLNPKDPGALESLKSWEK